jgi:hypothetical protein
MSDGDSQVLAGDNARAESLVMRRADADAVRSQARTKQWVNRIKALVETKKNSQPAVDRMSQGPITGRQGGCGLRRCVSDVCDGVRCPRSRGR